MIRQLKASFTRPADTTAYAANDLVANSTTAGSVSPLKFEIGPTGGRITTIRIEKTDETDVANATFSIRLFDSSPTVANGDNGAISHTFTGHIATIPLTTMVAGTDNAYAQINLGETNFVGGVYTAGPYVYALLEVEAAYSPASGEIFTVYLTVDKG